MLTEREAPVLDNYSKKRNTHTCQGIVLGHISSFFFFYNSPSFNHLMQNVEKTITAVLICAGLNYHLVTEMTCTSFHWQMVKGENINWHNYRGLFHWFSASTGSFLWKLSAFFFITHFSHTTRKYMQSANILSLRNFNSECL